MRILHLYPFLPAGRHGGTLRLRAAVAGTEAFGTPEIHCYDARTAGWVGPLRIEELATLDPPPPRPPRGAKRTLFPSTLWESGHRAVTALAPHLEAQLLDPRSAVLVHTTYLAASLRFKALSGATRLVDVYDLVWRAHLNDARAGGLRGALRTLYAQSVRAREPRLLAAAHAVLVAGWDDFDWLAMRAGSSVSWVPTPTPVSSVAAAPSRGALRVGFIGNFAHAATFDSAERLLASPLASDPAVRIVLAGHGSREALGNGGATEVLGEIERVEDFYARIDCAVVPVSSGSGIKCKLAEAIMAGRPVITTELGASGYPPHLRGRFTLCPSAQLDAATVKRCIAGFDPACARAEFEGELGWERVTRGYRDVLAAALSRSER